MTRSGLIFGDRYRLDKQIAAGGVGQVWQATDLVLERPVALKVLRPEYADHPETLERFRKEAKNAGALSNPHVAQVYDYGPGPDGAPYLVMELVDGPSLADVLAVDPIEPTRALDIVAQAADGLSAAHRAGLVHRDVKPGNILISGQGLVKVTDFGIAYAAGQAPVTGPGLVMGTTQYMAPERIAGDPGSAASDVYALGIVLHECLTGVPPHDGTPADVMAAHLYLPLPPLPAGLPAELEDLVGQLTVKDPAKRISDASELSKLAAALRDVLGGGPSAPPSPAASHSGAGSAVPGPVSPAARQSGPGNGDGNDNTLRMAPGGIASGTWYDPDEWAAPSRMSLPVSAPGGLPGGGQPGQPARWRAGALAVGAAVLASTGMVVLLVSGTFGGASDANQGTSGSAAASSTGARPPSRAISPVYTGSAAATTTRAPAAVTTPRGKPSAKRATATPTRASDSPSAPPSDSVSSTPSATDSGTPSDSQSATPGESNSSSPSASPSATNCFLGICL